MTEAATTDASRGIDTVPEIRAACYLLPHPAPVPWYCNRREAAATPRGLLVGGKGKRAFLIMADMAQLPYRVWLVRSGQRVPAGQIAFDFTGWGSLTLEPTEPVFQFKWAGLGRVENNSSSAGTETMALRSKIEHSPGGE